MLYLWLGSGFCLKKDWQKDCVVLIGKKKKAILKSFLESYERSIQETLAHNQLYVIKSVL